MLGVPRNELLGLVVGVEPLVLGVPRKLPRGEVVVVVGALGLVVVVL